MKKWKINLKSISFKLTVSFCVMAVVQSVLVAFVLIQGGIIKESQKNAYQIFGEKVDSRKDNLENEMNHVWTNFGHYTSEIRQYFTDEALKTGKIQKTDGQMLEELSPLMLEVLNITRTTGVFLILDEEDENGAHEGLYLRNLDPATTGTENYNAYLAAGPFEVLDNIDIVTDVNWSPKLKLNDTNKAFYEKAYGNMGLSNEAYLLGYWSPPFSLFPNEDKVVTYSIPLADKEGNPIGVFGVEISVDYLYRYLAGVDYQARDAYGYTLGVKREGSQEIEVVIAKGALQSRLFREGDLLELLPVKDFPSVELLQNARDESSIYICKEKLGLYYNNTPFAGEEWYLMGISGEKELLYLSRKLEQIFAGAILISLFAGIGVSVFFANTFTRFSRLMELSEVPVGAFEWKVHKKKVFMTRQVAKLLNLTKIQSKLFSKDKDKFIQYLEEVCCCRPENDHVFVLKQNNTERWLRIYWRSKLDVVRGVVEDVTEEVVQKRALIQERDCDELTKVKNRKAFSRTLEEWNEELAASGENAGILMCDLNGLKRVNDALGHDKGDEYLSYAAAAICEAFPAWSVYRIGGDEFVVLFRGMDLDEIREGEIKLQEKMDKFYLKAEYGTGVAIGYASFLVSRDTNLENVLTKADARMYMNKKAQKKKQEEEGSGMK